MLKTCPHNDAQTTVIMKFLLIKRKNVENASQQRQFIHNFSTFPQKGMFIYKKPRVKVLFRKPVQCLFMKHGSAAGRVCGNRVLSIQKL